MHRFVPEQQNRRRTNACRRYYLEIVGRKRFRVQSNWEQDGYRVAQPAHLQDEPAPTDPKQLVCFLLSISFYPIA